MSPSEKQYTVYSNQITSHEPEDVRGTYVHNTIFFGYLPNDFEAITFYKCLGFGFTDSEMVSGIAFSEEEIKDVRVYSTAVIEDVDLSGYVFENVFGFQSIEFSHCDFRNTRFLEPCDLHLNLFGCSLEGAVLSQSSSLRFNLKLSSTPLVGSTLERFDLSNLYPNPSFRGVTLRNCLYQGLVSDLRDINLAEEVDGVFTDDPKYSDVDGFHYLADYQDLRGADFSIFSEHIADNPNLFSFADGGSLRSCDLRNSNFDGLSLFACSILSGSDLRGSSLQGLDVKKESALLDLSRTDLRGLRGFSLISKSQSTIRVSLFESRFEPSLLQSIAEGVDSGVCIVTLDICSSTLDTDIRSKFQVYRVPKALDKEPTTHALSRALGVENLDEALLEEVTISLREGTSRMYPIYIGKGCKLLGFGVRYRYSSQQTEENPDTWENVYIPPEVDCSDSIFASLRTRTRLDSSVFDRSKFVDVEFWPERRSNTFEFGSSLRRCSFRQSIFEETKFLYDSVDRCDFSESYGDLIFFFSVWDWHVDECDFTKAKLTLTFCPQEHYTQVYKCNFSYAEIDFKLDGKFIQVTDTDFEGSRISNLNAEGQHLRNCDLRGAYFDSSCSFKNANFTGSIYDEHTVIDLEAWQLEEMTFVESGLLK